MESLTSLAWTRFLSGKLFESRQFTQGRLLKETLGRSKTLGNPTPENSALKNSYQPTEPSHGGRGPPLGRLSRPCRACQPALLMESEAGWLASTNELQVLWDVAEKEILVNDSLWPKEAFDRDIE